MATEKKEVTESRKAKFLPGKPVVWTSQAGGKTRVKAGTVVSTIPPGCEINLVLDACGIQGIASRRIQGNPTSTKTRYLVEVPEDGKPSIYYAPDAASLEKQN